MDDSDSTQVASYAASENFLPDDGPADLENANS